MSCLALKLYHQYSDVAAEILAADPEARCSSDPTSPEKCSDAMTKDIKRLLFAVTSLVVEAFGHGKESGCALQLVVEPAYAYFIACGRAILL